MVGRSLNAKSTDDTALEPKSTPGSLSFLSPLFVGAKRYGPKLTPERREIRKTCLPVKFERHHL